jgi:hypothetical protein
MLQERAYELCQIPPNIVGDHTLAELEIMFTAAEKRLEKEDYKWDLRVARICLYLNLPYRKAGEIVSTEEFMPGYKKQGLSYEQFKAMAIQHNAQFEQNGGNQ